MPYIISLIALLVVLVLILVRHTTIYEFQRGLAYTKGQFKEILEPGRHWYIRSRTYIASVDIRPRIVTIPGQEVLSSDGVGLKVSLVAQYQITDANLAVNKVQSYEPALYAALQVAVRDIIGGATVEEVLAKRNEFSAKLMEIATPKAREIGLELMSADVKDIMFPGALKQIFAQAAKARQEGLAALERARCETAALRSLANAAKLLESNPTLMQLRIIQSVGESSGNTLVLGFPSQTMPLPVRTKEADSAERPKIQNEQEGGEA